MIAVGFLGLAETFGLGRKDMPIPLVMVAMLIGTGLIWILVERKRFNLTIVSSAGETHALTSRDEEYIRKIVGAINEAIVHS